MLAVWLFMENSRCNRRRVAIFSFAPSLASLAKRTSVTWVLAVCRMPLVCCTELFSHFFNLISGECSEAYAVGANHAELVAFLHNQVAEPSCDDAIFNGLFLKPDSNCLRLPIYFRSSAAAVEQRGDCPPRFS